MSRHNSDGDNFDRPMRLHAEISLKRSMNSASSSKNLAAPRPLRRCRSASPALPRPPLLTSEQQNLIKKSWQRVPKSSIGKTIYQRMVAKCPEAKKLFMVDNSTISRHERYFADLIQSAVDNLTDMERALQPWLEMIGKGHAGFAIRAKHWDAFGEALVSAISDWIGPGKLHRETVKAWMILSSFFSDQLGAASQKSNGDAVNAICTPRIQLLTLVSTGPSQN
uniref:Globin family profile domain-containing protein n=1 Tax=Panagrolaimus sp. JU765 TaxID=591449 RepID=A0AC34PY52_9BILA